MKRPNKSADKENVTQNKRPPKKPKEDKVKNKLEGMQCNLMASNASAIFNYLYTKYYEQLIPIVMSDE